jgi:Spy/CpxP family protein refolding chaperone
MCKAFLYAALLGTGLLAVGAGVGAVAHPGEHGQGPICEHMARMFQAHFGRLTTLHAELSLTDEQRAAMHETLKAHHADIAAAIKPVVAARRELHAAVLADTPDDKAIREAAGVLGKSIGDAATVFAKIKVELVKNAKLTPKQMEKITEFRADTHESVDTFLKELEKRH